MKRRRTTGYRPMGTPLNPSNFRALAGMYSTLRGRKRSRGGAVRTATAYAKNRPRNYGGVLGGTDADRRSVYSFKRMPRKKRLRWKSFVKKVSAVSERELGARTVLFNDAVDQRNQTGGQNCLTIALYSFNSGAQWISDLGNIQGCENAGNPTIAAGGSVLKSTRFLFQSAVLDLTFRNTSTFRTSDLASESLDGRAAIELDIYEIVHRKTTDDRTTNLGDFTQVMNYSNDPEIGGTGTDLTIASRGASPFEFGRQMGFMGCKIIRKTKYFIPNGQTITHQVRDPSRHSWSKEQMSAMSGYACPGVTRTLYFVYKFVPGITIGSTPATFQLRCNVGITRKYMYKIQGETDTRSRLLGGNYTAGDQV